MSVGVGDGTTITFGTSGFTGNIVAINGPDGSRAAVDTTHLGSAGWKAFLAAGTVDPGTISLEVQYDPAVTVPVTGALETVVVDPAASGNTLSCSGFISNFSHAFEVDTMMQLTLEVKLSGEITGI